MADPKETVYSADPHTRAKHRILEEYLKRWLPILARQSQRIGGGSGRLLYVDGFAGAGEYAKNVPGSPLVAIDTALEQCHTSAVPIHIKLIELRPDRVAHLRGLVAERRARIGDSRRLIIDDPIEGDCEQQVLALIDEHDQAKRKLGPALFFLDQFGYSSFSIGLVRRILQHEVCEVFSYLNWNMLNPFMTDETKWTGITKAFGGDEWKEVLDLSGKQKEDRFREIYLKALRERGGARYSYPFAMRDQTDRVIYWLFFSTNNLRGLEEMKEAMWKVDRSGGFEFSDRHASELGRLFKYDEKQLSHDLAESFDGRELSVEEVHEYVIVNTPATNYKGALKLMESSHRLEAVNPPSDRRMGSFTDPAMRVRIRRNRPHEQQSLF